MPSQNASTRIGPLWIAGLTCAALAILAYLWTNAQLWNPQGSGHQSNQIQSKREVQSGSQALRQLIDKHLDKASQQVQNLQQRGYPAIEVAFSKAYDNVPKYSESILGFKSKWKLVLDKLPGNDHDRHETYLKEQFEQHIFSTQQLETAVKQAILDRLMQVRDIENQMLVDIRADIQGLPDLVRLEAADGSEYELQFRQALAEASQVVSEDLSSNVESQLVSLVAGEVMAQVAIRMGVSAGILSTGAASGWATLGVGLVAGVLIDQIVTRIWDWWSEPEAELSFQISKQLSLVHDLICKGDSDSEGLDGRFRRWSIERDRVRREAILKVFFSSEAQNENETTK
jgi:hypothetical protein